MVKSAPQTITVSAATTWDSVVAGATSGSGSTDPSTGVIGTLQPYGAQAVAWVYVPPQVAGAMPSCAKANGCGEVIVVTQTQSVTVFGFGPWGTQGVVGWVEVTIPVSVAPGNVVILQLVDLTSGKTFFNRGVTVSSATTLPETGAMPVPPSPYTGQWQQWACQNGVISAGTCAVWFPPPPLPPGISIVSKTSTQLVIADGSSVRPDPVALLQSVHEPLASAGVAGWAFYYLTAVAGGWEVTYLQATGQYALSLAFLSSAWSSSFASTLIVGQALVFTQQAALNAPIAVTANVVYVITP